MTLPRRLMTPLTNSGVLGTAVTGIGENSDAWSLTLLPSYDVARSLLLHDDKLQFNLRYQLSSSRDAGGLVAQRRYEREVGPATGDRYQAFYAGLNYYIYGYKLKLMAGAEYAVMEDDQVSGRTYDGWTYMSAVRMYF